MKTSGSTEWESAIPFAWYGNGLVSLSTALPLAVMLTVALTEMVLANRKYGLFTGATGPTWLWLCSNHCART